MNCVKIVDIITRAVSISCVNQDVSLSLPATNSILAGIWEKAMKEESLGDIHCLYSTFDGKERKDFVRIFSHCVSKKTTIRCTAGDRIDIDLDFSYSFRLEQSSNLDVFKTSPIRVLSWADVWIETPPISEIIIHSFELIKETGKDPTLSI